MRKKDEKAGNKTANKGERQKEKGQRERKIENFSLFACVKKKKAVFLCLLAENQSKEEEIGEKKRFFR